MKFSTRYMFLITAMFIGIVMSVCLGFVLYEKETTSINQQFKRDVDDKVAAIEREILLNLEVMYSIKGLFDSSKKVSLNEFTQLTENILNRHKNIEALTWVPRITQDNLRTRHSDQPTEHSGLEIEQHYTLPTARINEDKKTTYPITFVAPKQGNAALLGFDMGSEMQLLSAMHASRDSGKLIIENNVNFQHAPTRKGIHIIVPVFAGDISSIEARRVSLRGYAIGLYDAQALFSSAIMRTAAVGLHMSLVDISDQNARVLYRNYTDLNATQSTPNAFYYKRKLFEFGGRQWYVQASPSDGYLLERRTVLPLITSLFGSLATVLMSFYVFLTMQHSRVVESRVNARTKELYEAKKILEALSRTDSLTDIGNRRFFDEYLETEWNRASRENTPISMIMIDIDHFKLFNDTYGHAEGDECLKLVAHALKNSLKRPSDIVTRYGGEEFIIILPNTDDASALAETCRENIEALKISHGQSITSSYLTVSIGIATVVPDPGQKISEFINQTDSCLYAAKATGRNRVVSSHTREQQVNEFHEAMSS